LFWKILFFQSLWDTSKSMYNSIFKTSWIS